jgi:hypothetical protein
VIGCLVTIGVAWLFSLSQARNKLGPHAV